ncbi:HAMP domain-containing sensor histidine kinase [Shimia sp.]|uniref:sensor histidine kinase n=1 Tax=Shimia sp. TaxID=1954381 RepID=UPI003B8E01F3
MPNNVRQKWRPRLWAVVATVLGVVLSLPFAGLFLFKFYANQLVQQTEESLLAQAAMMSAVFAQTYDPGAAANGSVPERDRVYTPHFPSLSMQPEAIRPPRPDTLPVMTDPLPIYLEIGPDLSRIASEAQASTLAGYRLLDPLGNVIGGSAEVGRSLSHVEEVARALRGETVSVARERVRGAPEPALYAFSRGTRVRVFVAMPVRVKDEIVGAVYISRTPNHIFRFLYGERFNLVKASLFVLISTGLIGFLFWRFITRPIHALIERTQTAGNKGQRWEPPNQYGTREIERLSHSFQSLTERLQSQQDALKTYTAHVTHELKSPLTAVKGAAELLADGDMTAGQQEKFINNITRNTTRMEELLESMRAFSLAEQSAMGGITTLNSIEDDLQVRFLPMGVSIQGGDLTVPIHKDTLRIILTHILENAQQHGATEVELSVCAVGPGRSIIVSDNGKGISEGNHNKVLQPFFTTRRDQGGTGMGLNIVNSTLNSLNGVLEVLPSKKGATFRIMLKNSMNK